MCKSFFVCRSIALHLFCSLFFMISTKANGRCERFYDAELPSPIIQVISKLTNNTYVSASY